MEAMLRQTTDEKLTREVSDWRSLHALSSRLLQLTSLSAQLEEVLRTVANFHHSDKGVISLFDQKAGGLVTVASLGITEDGLK